MAVRKNRRFKLGTRGIEFDLLRLGTQQILESDFSADLVKLEFQSTSTTGHKQVKGNILIVNTGTTDIQELRLPKVEKSLGQFFIIQNRADTGVKSDLRITDYSGDRGVVTLTDGQATVVFCDGTAWYSIGAATADGYGEDGVWG